MKRWASIYTFRGKLFKFLKVHFFLCVCKISKSVILTISDSSTINLPKKGGNSTNSKKYRGKVSRKRVEESLYFPRCTIQRKMEREREREREREGNCSSLVFWTRLRWISSRGMMTEKRERKSAWHDTWLVRGSREPKDSRRDEWLNECGSGQEMVNAKTRPHHRRRRGAKRDPARRGEESDRTTSTFLICSIWPMLRTHRRWNLSISGEMNVFRNVLGSETCRSIDSSRRIAAGVPRVSLVSSRRVNKWRDDRKL